MSQLARRLTAAVLLAAILAMAVPAGAASLPRTQPQGNAAVLGSLWNQLVTWLTGLWAGPTPDPRLPARKVTGVPSPTDSGDPDANPVSQERGVLIDPNG